MVFDGNESKKERKTIEAFGNQWTIWGAIKDLYRNESELFAEFENYKIPEDFFKDKLVLDAGCGMGRFSYSASKKGTKIVIGIDPSKGIFSTRNLERGKLAFIRANISNLPFRPKSFDSIISIGVLHHTTDMRANLENLVELLKYGGKLFIMVYKNQMIKNEFAHTLLRGLALKITHRQLYYLCSILALPHFVVSLVKPYRKDGQRQRPYKRAVCDNFDWLSCHYQFFYTEEEIRAMYEKAGLFNIKITNPDYFGTVCVIGTRDK